MVAVFLLVCKKPVDHNILMGKSKHGIRVAAYSWFESCLKGRRQHVSINGFNSKDLPFLMVFHKVVFIDHYFFFRLCSSTIIISSLGCVLRPLLFLLYINYLHTAIKFCKDHIILLMTLIFCILVLHTI